MIRHFMLLGAILTLMLTPTSLLHADVVANSPLTSTGAQLAETSVGSFVADALKESVSAPIALVAAGCLRDVTIPQGKVSIPDILLSVQYPDDKVAVIDLTGAEIRQALERSLSIYPQKNLGFLQVSGLHIVAQPESPRGHRIISIALDKGTFSDEGKYQVATTTPIANGAYGYFTIWSKAEITKGNSVTVRQAIEGYLQKHTSLDYSHADRIVLKED